MDKFARKEFISKHQHFEPFKGKTVFMTGGTGFFGKWLLQAFAFANSEWGMDIKVASLSRNPERFLKECPQFSGLPGTEFIAGDVRDFKAPGRNFDFVIHAATEASAKLERENPQEMSSVVVDGTRHVLDFAKLAGARRVLDISSGGVYGQQPQNVERIAEDMPCEPFTAYGKGKLEAERLCTESTSFECPIARCFAFVGPYLPFASHFAVGNFIRDALSGSDIVIQGDGSPVRSYMYASDLVLWLLRILAEGRHGRRYNVGSDESISIRDLALKVRDIACSKSKVLTLGKATAGASNRYVPDTSRSKAELGTELSAGLDEALLKTIEWGRSASSK